MKSNGLCRCVNYKFMMIKIRRMNSYIGQQDKAVVARCLLHAGDHASMLCLIWTYTKMDAVIQEEKSIGLFCLCTSSDAHKTLCVIS